MEWEVLVCGTASWLAMCGDHEAIMDAICSVKSTTGPMRSMLTWYLGLDAVKPLHVFQVMLELENNGIKISAMDDVVKAVSVKCFDIIGFQQVRH